MELSFEQAAAEDVEPIFELNNQLILTYENLESIGLDRVLGWVHKKIQNRIQEYTTIYADGEKAGYYHFYRNEEGELELDDLYVFPEFRNRGIGSNVISRCCSSAREPVMLYVFIRNHPAAALYQRMGFEIVQTIRDSRYLMRKLPKN